jgi:UDP:flavonoid glycosyltransferase YjiC (YdhE family)
VATVMWACWDGGGNLTPSLGVAEQLRLRGHDVAFYGRPDMVDRVQATGLAANELSQAWADQERYAFHPLRTVFGYTSSPAVGAELVDVAAAAKPDVVVIDAMFTAALQVAPELGCPTAVMVHTLFHNHMAMWRANFAMQSESRQRAGFDALDPIDCLWGDRGVLHVNALRAFDGPPAVDWANVVHGAPVLTSERRAVTVEIPWDESDPTPIVLLSFSTVSEQRDASMLQAALDALSVLPVHVVATTGGIVDPGELVAADNVWLVPFADHEQLMGRASFVVGHGGHGTTMRALRRGLPIVGIPAKGGDQAPNLALVEAWGAGLALPGDADATTIRAAAENVLTDDRFAREARVRARSFPDADGAVFAADSVEALVGR